MSEDWRSHASKKEGERARRQHRPRVSLAPAHAGRRSASERGDARSLTCSAMPMAKKTGTGEAKTGRRGAGGWGMGTRTEQAGGWESGRNVDETRRRRRAAARARPAWVVDPLQSHIALRHLHGPPPRRASAARGQAGSAAMASETPQLSQRRMVLSAEEHSDSLVQMRRDWPRRVSRTRRWQTATAADARAQSPPEKGRTEKAMRCSGTANHEGGGYRASVEERGYQTMQRGGAAPKSTPAGSSDKNHRHEEDDKKDGENDYAPPGALLCMREGSQHDEGWASRRWAADRPSLLWMKSCIFFIALFNRPSV